MIKVRELKIHRIKSIIAQIGGLVQDKRMTGMGWLKVFVYVCCDVYGVAGDEIRSVFNTLCRECGVSNTPVQNWKLVGKSGAKFKEDQEEEYRRVRAWVVAGDFKPLMEEIVGAGRKHRGSVNVQKRAVVTSADGWCTVVGKSWWREAAEKCKLVVWGVHEAWYTEIDVKRECMRVGMDGNKFKVRRVGRDKGRRVEIACETEGIREDSFEKVRNGLREFGWRVVKGRSFQERETVRKARGAPRAVEVALRNYYDILSLIEEEEAKGRELGDLLEGARQDEGRGKGNESKRKEKAQREKCGLGKESKDRKDREGVYPSMRVGTWNVCGIGNKWDQLTQVMERREVDILGVTEHHMRKDESHKMGPNNKYVWFGKVSDEVLATGRRGAQGVGFLVHSRVVDLVSIVDNGEGRFKSRHMWLKVRCNGNSNVFFGVVYMPVDNSADVAKVELLEEIRAQRSRLSVHGEVFILGDFNARVGVSDAESGTVIGAFGEVERNRSGRILIEWLRREGMVIFNGRDVKKGVEFTRVDYRSKSVLDYVIGSKRALNEGVVQEIVVAQEKEDFIGSDHRMVYAVVRIGVQRVDRSVSREVWKIRNLRERQKGEKGVVENEMAVEIRKCMSEWCDRVRSGGGCSDVNETFAKWKSSFEQVCTRVVGKKKVFVRKGVKKTSGLLKKLYDIRNIVRKEAEVAGNGKLFETASGISEKIKSMVMRRNRGRWRSFCEGLQEEKMGSREFFASLKKVLGSSKQAVSGIRNSEGEVVNNSGEVRSVWRDFFEVLGRDTSAGRFDEDFKNRVEKEIIEIEKESKDVFVEELDGPISTAEISEQLKVLKSWKAGGLDGFRNELLKLCNSKEGLGMLAVLLNEIWDKECLPDEMAIGRIVTLFKGGDVYDCGDYRGISLLSVVYKLFSAILNRRLTRYCEKNGILEEEQGGFREDRGCIDQVFSLYSIVGERMGDGKDTFMCFIDIKKAYDKVWRDGLWRCLAEYGVKGKMWRMLRAIYASSKATVLVDGSDSEVFDIELGVRQGDVISPLLFSIFFNGLIKDLKEKGIGVEVQRRLICGLWYADDTSLLTGSKRELSLALRCVDDFFFKWRLEANAKKSGVMIVAGGEEESEDDEEPFLLGGEIVPVVERYKYLGIWFNKSWTWEDHIEHVLRKMDELVNQVEHRFWKNRAVDVRSKMIAWKSIFRPVMEYGAEVWWPGASDLEKFERLQKKVCKWSLGCAITTIDEIVLGELGVPTVESRFSRAKVAWAGVLECMDRKRIAGLCKDLVVKGRGKRMSWRRVVEKNLQGLDIEAQFQELFFVEEREERAAMVKGWKAIVKGAVGIREIQLWRERACVKVKADLYLQIKDVPRLEEYLFAEDFMQGGQLRFKLRSGSIILNQEKGRRSECFQDRMCEACDGGVEESVLHFLFECPAYEEERDKFSKRLGECCVLHDMENVLQQWSSEDMVCRAKLVLSDCFIAKSRLKENTHEVTRQIRIISNHFLNAIWDARKHILFSDLVYASGAQKPRSGSAS